MALKDRIKEARQNKHLTQEQLALKIGIAKSTLAGYETGIREPSVEIVGKIMYVLDVDANYLWQDEMGSNFPVKVSYDEMEHIKKYRALDSQGKKTVDYILKNESQRTSTIAQKDSRIAELEQQSKVAQLPDRSYLEPNAAHERTDIEMTEEMQQSDDDVMDNDDEWK